MVYVSTGNVFIRKITYLVILFFLMTSLCFITKKKLDGVAPLMANPLQCNLTIRQNHPILDLPQIISITSEQIS